MRAARPPDGGRLGGAQRLQEAVRAVGDRLSAEAGEMVLRQGGVGAALYVVESGALDVMVEAGDGVRVPVARLGPGSHFGEMSLLTGTPVSADVVACEPTVLYAAGADEFRPLIERDPALLECLAEELATRLQRTNDQLAAQQQHHAALGRLIASQHGCPFRADLPSLTRATSATEAAADDRPVLVTGEEGVGKRALAQYIHSLSRRAVRALLVVDCAGLATEEARQRLFGDAEPTAVTRFAERLGFLQAADGGALVLADVDRLPVDVQADLAAFLATPHPPGSPYVSLRLFATATRSLDELKDEGVLHSSLADAFAGGHAIGVAPLRKRRRDIVPLAEHFLEWIAQRRGQAPKSIGESARRELQGYDFPFGNAAELRQVTELAANLAEGDAISAEHLFFGPTGAEAPQIDLLRWPSVERAALDGSLLGWLRALVAVGFAAIVVACLVASQHPIGRLANLLIWAVWWPGLIISLLLLGRAWCAICPLSSGAEAVQRACGRNLAPSDRLSRVGPVLALVGLVGIVWVEEATDMAHHPTRTALLLLSLALAAAFVGWLYQRHAWCRYLCPLGAMGGVFAVASGLRVRARREVCAASCTGHECYKGTDTSGGCPMFNHALYLTSGQHCKLCLRCLQDCPHRSPRLVLQPPLRDMWRSDLLSPDLVPLATVIAILVLLLAATRTASLGMPGSSLWFAVGCAITAAIGLALVGLFSYRRRTDSSRDISWASRVAYAYAPAAGAVLLAFRLYAIPGLDDLSLSLTAPGGSLLALTLLQLAQGLTVMLGGALTLWALWRVARLRFEGAVLKAGAAWIGLGSLAVAWLVLALSWLA